jgi:hypothetical protein
MEQIWNFILSSIYRSNGAYVALGFMTALLAVPFVFYGGNWLKSRHEIFACENKARHIDKSLNIIINN